MRTSALAITAGIWMKALLIDVLLIFLYVMATGNFGRALMYAMFCFIAGFIFTAPLLFLAVIIVKSSVTIPYLPHAQISWLIFSLSFIVIAFFILIGIAFDVGLWEPGFQLFIAGTIVSLVTSVLLSRYGLQKLKDSIQTTA